MSRGFASKSVFGFLSFGYENKSILNPVSNPYGGSGVYGGYNNGNNSNITISKIELESLLSIQQLYTAHLANKTYTDIPVNFTQYLKLREIANLAVKKYSQNKALSILFQITVDGITGAINAYGLNTLNTETKIQNLYLQGVLEEIINGVNVTKAFDLNTGTLAMNQTFEVAPLFRYYISLYGIPDPTVGFDPVKLSLVLTALENSGIDPYQ
jgi:hypothetical protein